MKRVAGFALVASLAVTNVAHAAEPPRVVLQWTAPEGCPAGARVTAEVDRILGDSGARPASPLDVRARVTRESSGGLRVRVETDRDGSTRVRDLRASSCEALADATAMILALMIDPVAAAAAPPIDPTPPIAAPPAPAPIALPPPPLPAAAPPLLAAPPKRGLDLRFHIAAWALADAGSLPAVSFAAGGSTGLSIGALRLEIGAGVWPARAGVIAGRASAGGDVSLIAGSAGACYDVLARAPFSLGPCAAIEMGRVHATGFGVTSPTEGSALWSAAKVGGLFAWAPVRRFAITLRLEAVVPLARPSFVLENVGEVHRAGAVAGRAGAGVEASF